MEYINIISNPFIVNLAEAAYFLAIDQSMFFRWRKITLFFDALFYKELVDSMPTHLKQPQQQQCGLNYWKAIIYVYAIEHCHDNSPRISVSIPLQ